MDQLPNDHPALQAFRVQTKTGHGTDIMHRCVLGKCTFRRLRNSDMYFCTDSLHVHVCSHAGCRLMEDQGLSGIYTCPLTGIEGKERSYVHHETVKVEGWGGVRFLKAHHFEGKRNRGKKQRSQLHVTIPIVSKLVSGMVRENNKKLLSLDGTARTMLKYSKHFADIVLQMATHCELYRTAECAPANLVPSVVAYGKLVYHRIDPPPTPHIFVAVVLSLLQVGLSVHDICVFPLVPWLARYAPPLTGYAALDNVQCRAMSICTRNLKRLLFPDGHVATSFVFTLLSVDNGQLVVGR